MVTGRYLFNRFRKNRESGRGIVEARLPYAITLSHQHNYYLNVNYLELAFSKQTYYSSVSSIEKEAITLYQELPLLLYMNIFCELGRK